jgi:hypothetical protein
MPTLTVSRGILRVHDVKPESLQRPELTPDVARVLGLLLQAYHFDLSRQISVRKLPDGRFKLTQ